MSKKIVLVALIVICMSLSITSFAATNSYTQDFEGFEENFELVGDTWEGWSIIRPTANGTYINSANNNKFASVTSYYHAEFQTKLTEPYVYEVDVLNEEANNNIAAFFVRAGTEKFTVQYGPASGYEFDGSTNVSFPCVGSSGFYILPNNGKSLSINIKTYDESQTYKIGNVLYSVNVNADFSKSFVTLKFVDDGQTVKIYADDELAFIVEISDPGKYPLGEETYCKKVVVKDKDGNVLGTVNNARVSADSVLIIGSRTAKFKFDNIKITPYSTEPEPNTQTFDGTQLIPFVICGMFAIVLFKRRQTA